MISKSSLQSVWLISNDARAVEMHRRDDPVEATLLLEIGGTDGSGVILSATGRSAHSAIHSQYLMAQAQTSRVVQLHGALVRKRRMAWSTGAHAETMVIAAPSFVVVRTSTAWASRCRWFNKERLPQDVALSRLLVLTLTLPASVLMIGRLYTRSQLVTQAEEAQARAEAATAHLRTIKHLTEATLAHLRLDELLPELLTRIQAILSVDTVVVLLVDDTGTMLVATAARGLEEEVQQGVRIPVGAGFAGRIASERHPIALDRIDDTTIINPLLRQKGIQALLGVPLLLEGRVIGVLHVGSLTPRHFTLEEPTLLQLVADRAALIIEHARLSEELQQLALVDERNRIAMDIHDGVLQSLYAIGLRLEECLDLVSEEPEEAITQLDQAIASINAAMGEIRRYIFNLRPLEIQGRTFPQTVQTLVTEFQANMHLPVAVQLAPDVPSRLPAGDATVLLQMIREVLMNAAKHAQASQIELDLERVKTDLQVTIRDNGRGFDLSRPVGTDHHGLRNLRERGAALGGQVDVSSSVGAGTQVQITIPVKG